MSLFSKNNKWFKDYRKYNKKYVNKDGYNTILSDKIKLSMNCYQTRLNNNTVVIGGAGTGKNRFFILPNLLQANCSYIIHDNSGINYMQTGEFFKEQGYKVKILDLREMSKSMHYNPLKYIEDYKDVNIMASCLLGENKEPFSGDCEKLLLSACILYLKEIYSGKEKDNGYSLYNVVKLLEQATVDENNPETESLLDVMFSELETINPESMAAKNYKLFKMTCSKNAKTIIINTLAKLQILNYTPLRDIMSKDDLDLNTFGDEKQILYVITPCADDVFNPIAKLLYAQTLNVLKNHAENDFDRYKLPVHVKFILDEFAQIGYIPNLVEPYWLRQANMSYTIILKSLPQLKTVYPKDWEYIIDNADTLLWFGNQGISTLEYMEKKLDGLISVGELPYMSVDECIIFIRGLKPIKDKKFNPIYHKNYKKIN